MKPKKHTKKYLNALLYTSAITFGLYLAIEELNKYRNYNNFYLFLFAIISVLTIELFINIAKRNRLVELNLNFNDGVNEISLLFHKLVLPVIYFIVLVLFGEYNFNNAIFLGITVFTFVIFYVFFLNLYAFFQHEVSNERYTHYVYDIIKFIIFFTAVDVISHQEFGESSILIKGILIFILAIFITVLMISRLGSLHRKGMSYCISLAGITAISYMIITTTGLFNTLQLSFLSLIVFYLGIAIIHHVITKTLTLSVLSEYFIVILVSFAVLYGVN